jgi:hypothetical protein
MKNISKIIMAVAIVVAVSFAAKAQPGSTGGFDDEPEDVPVDGGISLLAIAGAAYGYKKIIKTKHLSTKQLKPNFKIIK